MKDIFDYKIGAYIFLFTALFCILDIFLLLSIPITVTVLFHDVNNNTIDEFAIDELVLKDTIKEFIKNGYKPITPENFAKGLQEGFPAFSKNLLVTFDDGKQTSADAIKMLKKEFNINCVFFIITELLNCNNMVSESTIIDLQNNYGCLIGLHGKRHVEVTKIIENGDNLTKELQEASSYLSKLLNKPIEWYAYPYGETNSKAMLQVIKAGFQYIFTIEANLTTSKTQKHNLPRVMYTRHANITGMPDISDYAKIGYSISDFIFQITFFLLFTFMGILYLFIDKKKKKEKQSSL